MFDIRLHTRGAVDWMEFFKRFKLAIDKVIRLFSMPSFRINYIFDGKKQTASKAVWSKLLGCSSSSLNSGVFSLISVSV